MLPPHELKNKEFTHALRGYSAAEVDEYIEFVIEKYTELYRENDKLEKQQKLTQSQLDIYKNDEASIRGALVNAQRAAVQIVEEANERADVIMHASKTNCDRILAEFRAEVRREREELLALRASVRHFKEELFASYQTHIEMLERIMPETDENDEFSMNDEDFVRSAVDTIKRDIASGTISDAESAAEDFTPDLDADIADFAADKPVAPKDGAADGKQMTGSAPDGENTVNSEAAEAEPVLSDAERKVAMAAEKTQGADFDEDPLGGGPDADTPDSVFDVDAAPTREMPRIQSGALNGLHVERVPITAKNTPQTKNIPSGGSIRDEIIRLNRSIPEKNK